MLIMAGCSNRAEKDGINDISNQASIENKKNAYSGAVVAVTATKICSYPEKEPLVEKKRHKKLFVLEVAVTRLVSADSQAVIPAGATVMDEKGNTYETFPAVVAMAQSSGCIKGDDLKSYNNIWSGNLAEGETLKAFVVGFEIPDSAIIEKFYWNKNWNDANRYIPLNKAKENH